MYKLFSAALFTLLLVFSCPLSAKEHHGFPVVSYKDHLFFYFTVDKMLGGAPGTPPQYAQAYIMTPDHRKIKGPKINVVEPISAFRIVIEPPILFGNYTIVMENLTVGGAQVNYFSSNVIVKNSRNSKKSLVTVTSIVTLVPINPGYTLQGSFFPFQLFVDE